jgi:ferredoxin
LKCDREIMDERATLFQAYLDQHDQRTWDDALTRLLPVIHEVDRTGTEIWFHFYPLVIARALRESSDRGYTTRKLWLQGSPDLADHFDTSHVFLYGHRYWPLVATAINADLSSGSAPASLDLPSVIREIAGRVARQAHVDDTLTVGISAVGLMTLQQVGADVFAKKAMDARVQIPLAAVAKTPEQVLKARARDKGQGLFGFLRGVRRQHPVTFDEQNPEATFKAIETQHLTTAAANDHRDYRAKDARCREGPIPVQCRSASCGTCWIGVLGGREHLSPVDARERQRLREFGYDESDDPQPLIRLACMSQVMGPVSIVLPPYNGIFGKYRRQQEQCGDLSPQRT